MHVEIPISAGELFDKFTILKVKLKKIINPDKKKSVKLEHDLLQRYISDALKTTPTLYKQLLSLESINEELWDVLEKQRAKDLLKEFDEEFILLSRSVYLNNDKRFEIKNNINELTHSLIKEQKHYDT